ncbi:hypothetical protein DOT_1210 [Desulfosporosinus sp. OT]|nr:hypothetical protein DOT_1210 [Desulfosporosinus sp. OT]
MDVVVYDALPVILYGFTTQVPVDEWFTGVLFWGGAYL